MTDSVVRHVLSNEKLSTTRVTVFADRAEVQRLIRVKCEAGKNEVLVQGLASSFDSDSLRVDGRGSAVIREVHYQQRAVQREETELLLAKQFEAEIVQLQLKLIELQDVSTVLHKKLSMLSGVSDQVAGGQKDVFDLSESSLDNLSNFIAFYDQNVTIVQSQLRANDAATNKINDETALLRRKIDEIYHGGPSNVSNDVSIVLDSASGGEVDLDLFYCVNDASWTPSYDIRVSNSTTFGDKCMQVHYYGMVEQNTGENWTDAQMCLSTAQPSCGGVAPPLPTLSAFLQSKSKKRRSSSYSSRRRSIPNPNDAFTLLSEAEVSSYGSESDGFVNCNNPTPSMRHMGADESTHVTAVCFNIARLSTIPSDGAEHKVTIAIVDLDPIFAHETVPSKTPVAFLSAKAINTSAFLFLPGPTAIYVDGSFVARSALTAVSPMEEFQCPLGVDPSVRIDYSPAHKYREQSGIVSKSTVLAHEQRIEIKNTKTNDTVQIIVREQIPKSTDKDIKVQLISPRLPKNEKEVKEPLVKLDDNHNLEWIVHIDPGKTVTMDVKWKMEHPARKQVHYSF